MEPFAVVSDVAFAAARPSAWRAPPLRPAAGVAQRAALRPPWSAAPSVGGYAAAGLLGERTRQLACLCSTLLLARRPGAGRKARRRPLARLHCISEAAAPAEPAAAEPAAVAETEAATAPAAAAAADATPPRRQRVLSGVQPTGDLHLGNYFGAIKQWVGMQEEYECFFCIVDLHAITVPHDPKALRKATLSTAAAYLASGIDPDRSTVFVQSSVPQHAQLSWLLNTQTPMSWLQQMTQYKEKAVKQGKSVGLGLFAYPVLMAADILLYQADKVPVGEDQMEHLYLARDIAERMNRGYKKTAPKKRTLFRMPEPLVGKEGARVMGLSDGTNKMSKSDPNADSRINLVDDAAAVKRKIKRCKTDTVMGLELGNPERPEATNLLKLYALVTGVPAEAAARECAEDNWGTFKGKLTEAMVEYLTPIQGEYKRILEDQAFLRATLEKGRERAQEVAGATLTHVEAAMGFGY